MSALTTPTGPVSTPRSDRAVLEHGIETGIIRRLPHGEFIAW
jgi:ubiquinol-cytochrome c reductase cytochrome b subunit